MGGSDLTRWYFNCVSCFLVKKHAAFKWKDTISGFPVSPGSAEALVRCDGKIKYILIAYFIGNICAKNCRNRTVYVKIIASCKGGTFWETVKTWRHPRQRRTEPQPQVTCTESCMKLGLVVSETCQRAGRETDIQTRWSQYFALLPGWSRLTMKHWNHCLTITSVFTVAFQVTWVGRLPHWLSSFWRASSRTIGTCIVYRPDDVYVIQPTVSRNWRLKYAEAERNERRKKRQDNGTKAQRTLKRAWR